MKNLKGSLILLLAAFFWGTTFVAQVSGSQIGTFTYNASRCFVGSLFLVLFSIMRDCVFSGRIFAPKQKETIQNKKWPWVGGLCCGVVVFFAMTFQQGGISLYPDHVAAAGRAGFLTATYVVMVALLASIIGRKIHKLVFLSVTGTIIGMYLLCMKDGFSGIYKGDILEILCAVCFTGHILIVDHFSGEDSVKLSCLQFLVCGVLSLTSSLIFEEIVVADILKAAIPILYAGILSSGVAYTLQMVGQKYAEPAVASIVMSLESVIAVLAGAIVLHEVLSGREIIGCVFVFASVIIAQIPQFTKSS